MVIILLQMILLWVVTHTYSGRGLDPLEEDPAMEEANNALIEKLRAADEKRKEEILVFHDLPIFLNMHKWRKIMLGRNGMGITAVPQSFCTYASSKG